MQDGYTITASSEVFLLDPANASVAAGDIGQFPPKVKSPGLDRLGIVLGAVFVIVLAVGGVIWTATSWIDWAGLNARGVTVPGQLIEQESDYSSSTRDTSYYWRYSFTTEDGQSMIGRVRVNQFEYRADFEYGKPVQVVYLPDAPSVNTLAGRNITPWLQTLVVVVLYAILAIVAYNLLNTRRQNRRLRAGGQLVRGEVVKSGSSGKSGGLTIAVRYRFQSPQTGQTLEKTATKQRPGLEESDLPPEGTPLMILYVEDTLFRLL